MQDKDYKPLSLYTYGRYDIPNLDHTPINGSPFEARFDTDPAVARDRNRRTVENLPLGELIDSSGNVLLHLLVF